MNFHLRHPRLLAAAIFAVCTGVCAAQAQGKGGDRPSTPPASNKSAPSAQAAPKGGAAEKKENVSPASSKSAAGTSARPSVEKPEVEKVLDQFNAQRDSVLAQRQQLLEQLKSSTEANRDKIIAELQDLHKQLIESQRARGKQIRDEMRMQRPAAVPPGQR